MKTGKQGIKLIKSYEGLHLNAYLCPAGVPTIGYGSTAGVKMGMKITESQAEALLKADLARFERAVTANVKMKLTQGQFDALVSFAFNVGEGAFKSSTLLKVLNQGRFDMVPDQLLRWNKAGGKVLNGLTRRRASEAKLFTSGKF